MIRLMWSEWRRLWSRRMTRFFPATLALLMIAGMVIAYFVITNDENASPSFASEFVGALETSSILMPVMAFVIGASYFGADIKTGMLEQILTWEPRRLRLLTARTVIGLVSVAIVAMLLTAFLVALLYGLTSLTGDVDGMTNELWADIASGVARTGLAAGLCCALGLGVTLLVNNSVGSIVGFVIYWFIVEGFLVQAFLPQVAPYLPVTNANAFAAANPVQRIEGSFFSGDPDFVDSHTYVVAGFVLAAWVVAALVISAGFFRRRDIA